MAYRNRTTRFNRSNPQRVGQRNYGPTRNATARRRHELELVQNINPTTMLPLASGEYFGHALCMFERSFSAGTDDTPDTPTSSNNYADVRAMNGSRIENFKSRITIKNKGNIGGVLSVYRVALSYYDAHIWNLVYPTSCPVTFDSTTVGPADKRGNVGFKAPTATLISHNNWQALNGVKHYMEYLGDVKLGPEDSGDGGIVQLEIDYLPAKCRRSNLGMCYAYFFHNSADKNGGEALTLASTQTTTFDEIPTDDRLPYVN